MATTTITQESNKPDIQAARIAAAKQVSASATSGIGTAFNGLTTEAASPAHPYGVSYVSVVVDPAAVIAAAS